MQGQACGGFEVIKEKSKINTHGIPLGKSKSKNVDSAVAQGYGGQVLIIGGGKAIMRGNIFWFVTRMYAVNVI